jgi:hypothetical protein
MPALASYCESLGRTERALGCPISRVPLFRGWGIPERRLGETLLCTQIGTGSARRSGARNGSYALPRIGYEKAIRGAQSIQHRVGGRVPHLCQLGCGDPNQLTELEHAV